MPRQFWQTGGTLDRWDTEREREQESTVPSEVTLLQKSLGLVEHIGFTAKSGGELHYGKVNAHCPKQGWGREGLETKGLFPRKHSLRFDKSDSARLDKSNLYRPNESNSDSQRPNESNADRPDESNSERLDEYDSDRPNEPNSDSHGTDESNADRSNESNRVSHRGDSSNSDRNKTVTNKNQIHAELIDQIRQTK